MRCDSSFNYSGEFKRILPFPLLLGSHLDRGQREYGQSERLGKRAVGTKHTDRPFFFSAPNWTLPLILRVRSFIPPHLRNQKAQVGKPSNRSKRTSPNLVEGKGGAVIEWATGSSNDPLANCGTHRTPDTLTDDESVVLHFDPSNRRSVAASRGPFSFRPMASELALHFSSRVCTRCGVNPVYMDIETMDWCEECIWRYVNE